MWTREKQGKLAFRRLKIPGTLGQCLMAPPVFETGKFPFRRYLLGGVIMNLLTSCVIGIFFNDSPFAYVFAWIGLLLFTVNLLPLGFNDGMSLKIANMNEQQQYLLYLQLEVNYQFSIGKTYKELPINYYEILPTQNKPTFFNDWQEFIRLGYLLETRDWLTYELELNRLWKRKDTLILPYQIELKKELLFFLTLSDSTDSRIPELWNDQAVQANINQQLLNNTRIKASYYHFIQHQTTKAIHDLQNAREKNIPAANLGEFKLETQLNYWLENLICSSKNITNEQAYICKKTMK